jgi:recombination protein U
MAMINYPNGKKKEWAPTNTSAGGRGMKLESDINATNQWYLDNEIAVIHKKPTPITIVKVDYPKRSAAKITEAYFKLPSTTDYNGIYQSRYIDFEAKECASKTSFPFKSLHPHQVQHLSAVLKQGAVAFLIVRFTIYDETYYVPAEDVIDYWHNSGRRSYPYEWFQQKGYLIPSSYNEPVDYIKIVDQLYFDHSTERVKTNADKQYQKKAK